ncbi:MAG: hypothetical protein WA197_13660, partial [Candidatus Acidiferrales bacterium]
NDRIRRSLLGQRKNPTAALINGAPQSRCICSGALQCAIGAAARTDGGLKTAATNAKPSAANNALIRFRLFGL